MPTVVSLGTMGNPDRAHRRRPNLRRSCACLTLALACIALTACIPATNTADMVKGRFVPARYLGVWQRLDGDEHLPQVAVIANTQDGAVLTAVIGGLENGESGSCPQLPLVVRPLPDHRLLMIGALSFTPKPGSGTRRAAADHDATAAAAEPAPKPQIFLECFVVQSQGDHIEVRRFADDGDAALSALHDAGWTRFDTVGENQVLHCDDTVADFLAAHIAVLDHGQTTTGHYARMQPPPPAPAPATAPAVMVPAEPAWAGNHGTDEHGAWADLTVVGVTQRLRWCPPGTFTMGSPANEPGHQDDETQHPVTLTHGFWLADSECTQAFWQATRQAPAPGNTKGDQLPVESISWTDTQHFLIDLNAKFPTLNARLPTDAEWEYACRASSTAAYAVPRRWDHDRANGATHPVRTLDPNAWGLYDLEGNVAEWCADWDAEDPNPRPPDPVTDPHGPATGRMRIARGGDYFGKPDHCRSAYRNRDDPGEISSTLGFRFAVPGDSDR
jgi:formylglycine-generating enzyme required for sulfatase activity